MSVGKTASLAQAALRQLITDGPWVGVVLVAAAIGQWIVFHDGATPIVSSDGLLYLSDAHALPALQGLVDPRVPPGYPLLLAGIFIVAGRDNLDAVMIVQGVLFLAAILELYWLLASFGVHRVLCATVVSLLAAAPWLVQWERFILTETISFWAVITLFVAYTQLLRRPTWGSALVCGAIGASIPFTRPALSLVPAMLVLVLLLRSVITRRVGGMNAPALTALLFGLASYVPVGAYIAGNAAVNGCYCYTSISNLNLFGKIYEYGMKDFPADTQFAAIAENVRAADSINRFLESNPQFEAQNYAPLGAFARSQFLKYPSFTIKASVREIKRVLTLDIDHAVLLAHPYACRNDPNMPYPLLTGDAIQASDVPYCPKTTVSVGKLGEDVNRAIYFVVFLTYVVLPLSLALGVALVFAKPKRERAWLLMATSAVVASVIVSSSLAGYTAFDRLKVPVDGIALTAAVLMVGELWFLLSEVRRTVRLRRVARPQSA